jgi:hypothetical protein
MALVADAWNMSTHCESLPSRIASRASMRTTIALRLEPENSATQ